MPVLTGQTLVGNALQMIGAYQPSDQIDPLDAASCLARLNSMISSWNTERLNCFVDTIASLAYSANQASYTVGPGGQFNVQRPDQIDLAWVQDVSASPPQDIPQYVLSEIEYRRIAQKLVLGTYPTAVWYQPTMAAGGSGTGLGTLFVWPVPTNTAYIQFIQFKQFLSSGITLPQTLTLPEGYQEAIEENLALRIASLFGKQPTAIAQARSDPSTGESFAKIALNNLRRVNQRNQNKPQKTDVPMTGGRGGVSFNILTNAPNPPFRGA